MNPEFTLQRPVWSLHGGFSRGQDNCLREQLPQRGVWRVSSAFAVPLEFGLVWRGVGGRGGNWKNYQTNTDVAHPNPVCAGHQVRVVVASALCKCVSKIFVQVIHSPKQRRVMQGGGDDVGDDVHPNPVCAGHKVCVVVAGALCKCVNTFSCGSCTIGSPEGA